MKSPGSIVALVLSCAVFSAGGWWLSRAAAPAAPVPEFTVPAEAGLPRTTSDLVRTVAAQASTADLWRWCQSSATQEERHQEIFAVLVDRLGWAAWDRTLAIEDREQRKLTAQGVLPKLAERDPWRAFEAWRDYEKRQPDRLFANWGMTTMISAMKGMGQTSAPQMIEMIQSVRPHNAYEVKLMLDYRADFDFAAVVDFLNEHGRAPGEPGVPRIILRAGGYLPYVLQPANLLEGWARRSPVAMSQWLLEHHEQVSSAEEPRLWAKQAHRALHQIAGRSADTPGRAEALEILGRLPADYLEDAWSDGLRENYGTLSLLELEAATQMNQREAYVASVFPNESSFDHVDPSWAQLPVAERQPLLDLMERYRSLHCRALITPLRNEAWDRVLRRVKAVWGME